jgi:uncharacterized protein
MSALVSELRGFAVQLALFLSVPFLWYLATKRSARGFGGWLGLRRPSSEGILGALGWLALLGTLSTLAQFQIAPLRELLRAPHTLTGRLHQMGATPSMASVLLVAAVLKTALTEELLFRGFIAKRLIARLGLRRGNLLQASIFAGVHLLALAYLPADRRTPALVGFVFLAPFALALVAAWLNERRSGGSIVPGWVLHAGGNVVGYVAALLSG